MKVSADYKSIYTIIVDTDAHGPLQSALVNFMNGFQSNMSCQTAYGCASGSLHYKIMNGTSNVMCSGNDGCELTNWNIRSAKTTFKCFKNESDGDVCHNVDLIANITDSLTMFGAAIADTFPRPFSVCNTKYHVNVSCLDCVNINVCKTVSRQNVVTFYCGNDPYILLDSFGNGSVNCDNCACDGIREQSLHVIHGILALLYRLQCLQHHYNHQIHHTHDHHLLRPSLKSILLFKRSCH